MLWLSNLRTGFFAVLFLMGFSGCASLGNSPQQSATLATAVNTLMQAETDLYDGIIAISAGTTQKEFLAAFVVTTLSDAEGTAALYIKTPPGDYDKAKSIRIQLLNQLANYAQQINALASSGATAWPASQAGATANDTANLITSLYGGSVPSQIQPSVDLVNQIATIMVASKSAAEIQTLAKAAEPAISQIQTVIKNDDDIINIGINKGLIPNQQANEQLIVKALYNQAGSASDRLNLALSLPSTLPVITTLANKQQLINSAMKAIVAANASLAEGNNETALDLTNQAIVLAKSAIAISHLK